LSQLIIEPSTSGDSVHVRNHAVGKSIAAQTAIDFVVPGNALYGPRSSPLEKENPMLIDNLSFRCRMAFLAVGTLLAGSVLAAQEVLIREPAAPSIISLAPAQRPKGELLARNALDARFQHAPANYHVFAAATVGEEASIELLTLKFAEETQLRRIESKSADFIVEHGGTCQEGNNYGRGDSCSLLVRFTPQGPGHRFGLLEVAHSVQPEPLSLGLTGNGYAPVVSFTPALISTVATSVSAGTGTIKSATRLAIDGGDTLYIADTGNDLVKKMDSSGAIVNVANTPFAAPASVAADSFGILYTSNVAGSTYYFSTYSPSGVETAYGYAHTAGTCTVSAPCAFSAVGMSSPANMSMDNSDNLFFEEGTKGAAEMPVASISGGAGALNLWYLSDQFAYSSGSAGSFAVDAYGNLYTDYNVTSAGTCYLVEESLYNAEYSPTANRVAGGAACGFSGDGGQARNAEISSKIGQIAFDVAGDLYFADAGNQRVRRIDASTGIIHTIAGNGTAGYAGDAGAATSANLSNPTGLAVDSQGQVYILSNAPTAGPTQVIRKLGTAGFLTYASVLKGASSSSHIAVVANTGNSPLVLNNVAITGTNATDFVIDQGSTSCNLNAGATLASGASCKVGVIFKPTAAGTRTASLIFLDNTVNNTNIIQLSGLGALPAPAFTITSPASGTSVTSGTAVTFAVSVTSSSSPKPTGTIVFKVDSTSLGSVALSASGTASVSVTQTATGSHTLSASYSGDANFAAAGPITRTYTVTAAAVPAASKAATPANAAATCTSTVSPAAAIRLREVQSMSQAKGSAVSTAGARPVCAE
jgi:hypothetical protein